MPVHQELTAAGTVVGLVEMFTEESPAEGRIGPVEFAGTVERARPRVQCGDARWAGVTTHAAKRDTPGVVSGQPSRPPVEAVRPHRSRRTGARGH